MFSLQYATGKKKITVAFPNMGFFSFSLTSQLKHTIYKLFEVIQHEDFSEFYFRMKLLWLIC